MTAIISSLPSTSPDFSLGRAVGIGLAKSLTETALAKTWVGNATFKSALVKGVSASIMYMAYKKVNTPFVKPLLGMESTALTIDAVEDLIASSMRMWKSRQSNNASVELESSTYI